MKLQEAIKLFESHCIYEKNLSTFYSRDKILIIL